MKPVQKGFATMSVEKKREISRLGGIKSWEKGVAHKFTSKEARMASLKAWKNRRMNEGKNKHKALIGE